MHCVRFAGWAAFWVRLCECELFFCDIIENLLREFRAIFCTTRNKSRILSAKQICWHWQSQSVASQKRIFVFYFRSGPAGRLSFHSTNFLLTFDIFLKHFFAIFPIIIVILAAHPSDSGVKRAIWIINWQLNLCASEIFPLFLLNFEEF